MLVSQSLYQNVHTVLPLMENKWWYSNTCVGLETVYPRKIFVEDLNIYTTLLFELNHLLSTNFVNKDNFI